MYLQELPLVIFTLFTQTAVGVVLAGQMALSGMTDEKARLTVRRQSLVALVLFAVAAFISLFHTGTPLHGPFTLLNIGSSWLSREIAMLGVSGAILLWLCLMRRKTWESASESMAAWLFVLTGALLVFVMSKVYSQPTVPGWNTPGLLPSFLASILLLGGAWQFLALSCGWPGRDDGGKSPFSGLVLCALSGLVLMAFAIPLALPDPSALVNGSPLALSFACQIKAQSLHALASGLGVALLTGLAFRVCRGRTPSPGPAFAALALILAGEIIGRFVFYLSYSRLGM